MSPLLNARFGLYRASVSAKLAVHRGNPGLFASTLNLANALPWFAHPGAFRVVCTRFQFRSRSGWPTQTTNVESKPDELGHRVDCNVVHGPEVAAEDEQGKGSHMSDD